jgi:hypothetical protein
LSNYTFAEKTAPDSGFTAIPAGATPVEFVRQTFTNTAAISFTNNAPTVVTVTAPCELANHTSLTIRIDGARGAINLPLVAPTAVPIMNNSVTFNVPTNSGLAPGDIIRTESYYASGQ